MLAGFLEDVIDLNYLRGGDYFEPFAGGAGAALALLNRRVVSSLYLNDLDPRIFSFWRATLNQTSQMIDRVMSVPLTITEWQKQREISRRPSQYSQIDVGFAALYMNRCNRSGVLSGAGPIGGLEQKGKWRLDVRFYREQIACRLADIGKNRDRIFVFRLDAIDFLTTHLPRGNQRKKAFVYMDPPYVAKGQRLYLNAYDEVDHIRLAGYICRQRVLPWLMSYDDTPLTRRLYECNNVSTLEIDYKLHQKRSAEELIIAPPHLATPVSYRIGGKDRQLVSVAKETTFGNCSH